MRENLLRLAAVLLTAGGVAACDRPGGSAPLASAEAPSARGTSPAYPSTTPQPAQAAALAVRADPLSRDALSDTVVTGRIKAAIATDPAMAGADVSVNTDGGVVSLTGTVKSQEQAAVASAHAQGNDGVMRVDNHLSTLPL